MALIAARARPFWPVKFCTANFPSSSSRPVAKLYFTASPMSSKPGPRQRQPQSQLPGQLGCPVNPDNEHQGTAQTKKENKAIEPRLARLNHGRPCETQALTTRFGRQIIIHKHRLRHRPDPPHWRSRLDLNDIRHHRHHPVYHHQTCWMRRFPGLESYLRSSSATARLWTIPASAGRGRGRSPECTGNPLVERFLVRCR